MTTKYEELAIIVKYQLLVYIHPLNAKCMHLGLPFQNPNMLYMYTPLEEALQNEAVGMDFSVDSQYQF